MMVMKMVMEDLQQTALHHHYLITSSHHRYPITSWSLAVEDGDDGTEAPHRQRQPDRHHGDVESAPAPVERLREHVAQADGRMNRDRGDEQGVERTPPRVAA